MLSSPFTMAVTPKKAEIVTFELDARPQQTPLALSKKIPNTDSTSLMDGLPGINELHPKVFGRLIDPDG